MSDAIVIDDSKAWYIKGDNPCNFGCATFLWSRKCAAIALVMAWPFVFLCWRKISQADCVLTTCRNKRGLGY